MNNTTKRRRSDQEKDQECPTGSTAGVKTTGDVVAMTTDPKQSNPQELTDQSARRSDTKRLQSGLGNTTTTAGEDFQNLAIQSGSIQAAAEDLDDLKSFQKDLIEFYQHQHSTTSVSPLVEEHLVPLVEFYVKPQLVAIDLQHPFGNPTKTPVSNYQELFWQGTGKAHKTIYVTSSAGMGKTSFCKHICMTWCQAHYPEQSMHDRFKPEDIYALKGFEFLFYISLRDAHRSLCHLDDFIQDFVRENLSASHERTLDEILNNKKPSLIVMDGLDEWIHPEKCERPTNEHDIPHRKFRKNWTILNTTRPWKFDILHLHSNQIDSHVELNELDESSSKKLVQNAINVLNNRFQSGKTVEEFYWTTSQLKLGEIRKIPYLHLHCVCLWYDGRNIGNSKCEIYSNILELTLNRGTQKLGKSVLSPTQQERSATIPKCMENNEFCVHHRSLLMKIGELAFYALFGSENRQMLVMDYTFATNHLKPDELQTCLKLGLLSQNKVYGSVSTRIRNISFQHKTIQEFLAAFYMHLTLLDQSSANQNIHQLAVQTCTTLSHILEMSEVFIFLSGFSSAAYRDISWNLIHIVNDDENTKRYRSYFDYNIQSNNYNIVFKYQTLQVQCLEEMQLNRQDFQPLPLKDIIIHEQSKQAEYMSYIQNLIQGNSGGIKSLHVSECENTEEVTDILNRLDHQYFHSLEKLELRSVARQPDIERLLQQSVNTLQCLVIQSFNYKQRKYINESTVFSQVSSDTVLSMSLLNSLSLISLKVTHKQLENVTTFLTSRVTMIQINMANITCSDHDKSCPGVQFHLSGHDNLQMLGLINVPVSQLQVNTQHLEECIIGKLPKGVITSYLTSLSAAHNLQRLHCGYLIDPDIKALITKLQLITQLEELDISHTDLTDNRLVMTTGMTRLKLIRLNKVSMRSSDLLALINTISSLSQSAVVKLDDCTVTPESEYLTLKDDIRKSDSLTVTFDGINRDRIKVFKFQTVK